MLFVNILFIYLMPQSTVLFTVILASVIFNEKTSIVPWEVWSQTDQACNGRLHHFTTAVSLFATMTYDHQKSQNRMHAMLCCYLTTALFAGIILGA